MSVERHQDYQLTIPTLPVGGLQNVTLPLDSDAPFALRLTKTRKMPADGYRFRSPAGVYINSGPELDISPRGTVRYPQMIYPANGYIVVDIGNSTGAPISNVRVLFRGSKIFRDGQTEGYTYPDKCSLFPFVYPKVVTSIPIQSAGKFNNIQLQIKSDSDFALRYAFADAFHFNPAGTAWPGPANVGDFHEVYVTLRDWNYKAYSNEPIHINDLFGTLSPVGDDVADDSVAVYPNLFTPEIYVPRSGSLYFDILRNDTAPPYLANQVCDIHFRFGGAKVFHR